MSVVAHATALEHPRIVSVDFGKIVALMAIETATFEREASAPAEGVALGALHAGNRRMLVKGLKTCGRIRTHKKVHFLPATLPHQYE
jgi:hypothetical protein